VGLGHERARSSIRLTLGRWTTEAEIEQAAAILATTYHPA
jgi:cysteine sulfinate desulfinase/cysteine desulfurase-like protein